MKRCALAATGLAAAFTIATLIPAVSAVAEDTRVMYEIVVVAPRITRERVERAGVARVFTVNRDEAVNLADLDLSRTADMKTLEQRIADAAKRICEELANEYPFGQPRTPVCIRRAINDAMAQVDEAVEEAIRR